MCWQQAESYIYGGRKKDQVTMESEDIKSLLATVQSGDADLDARINEWLLWDKVILFFAFDKLFGWHPLV